MRADILLIAGICPCPCGAGKNTTQLVKTSKVCLYRATENTRLTRGIFHDIPLETVVQAILDVVCMQYLLETRVAFETPISLRSETRDVATRVSGRN